LTTSQASQALTDTTRLSVISTSVAVGLFHIKSLLKILQRGLYTI